MDVRQLAFMARQPSAALQSRDSFCGFSKRSLAFILANMMFWQPLVVMADGIVVNGSGTTLGQAGNGVPIVNIAAPNGSGLSHNTFSDYNVGQQGVILNNATNRTQSTQLGGIILGNANLGGRAANVILNEVNGGSPSQLKGYTEVAGQSAHVIVANPYGVSCNGCGFINTPKATLTTGKPVIENGQIQRYQVDQGSVAIEGAGLNASNIDQFEIITRSAKINAEIQAQHLAVIAGANDVDAKTLNATARTANPAGAPQLAIDSSALGGMYAGAIKLVGTEAGVGVKLDGKLIASGGDIQLDADGQLRMADATAEKGVVAIKAGSLDAQGAVYAGSELKVQTRGDLSSQITLAARDRISLDSGGQLTNQGIIEAGVNADNSRNPDADITLTAQNLDNRGKSIVASRDLTITTAQTLDNRGGTLSGQRQVTLGAGTLDNQNQGRVLSSDALVLQAGQLLNHNALITSDGELKAHVGHLGNDQGELSSLTQLTLQVTSLDNVAGLVMAGDTLDISASGKISNQGGALGAEHLLKVRAGALDNSKAGNLRSEGRLSAEVAGRLDNQDKGLIQATGVVEVQAGHLDNRKGRISAGDTLQVSGETADNRGGVMRADQALNLLSSELDNRDKGRLESQAAVTVEGRRLDNSGGLLSATSGLELKTREVLNNGGRIASKSDLQAQVDSLRQQGGELVAEGDLHLTGQHLDNRDKGLVASLKALTLDVAEVDNRGGALSGRGELQINGQGLNNSDGGKVLADDRLLLKVARVINQNQGLLFSKQGLNLSGSSLDNSGGQLVSQQPLLLTLSAALDNQRGLISGEDLLTLKVGSLDNRGGRLTGAQALSIDSSGALLNQAGAIVAEQGLALDSASLNNSAKGVISAKADARLSTGDFDNSQGGSFTSAGQLRLTTAQLTNHQGRIGSDQALSASVSGLDQQGGELFSNADLTLDLNHGQLNNQGGNLHTPGQLLLRNLDQVDNRGGEISGAKAFNLNARQLDNSGGKVLSNQALTLRIEQALVNVKGLMAAAALDSRSTRLDNREGELHSRGDLQLQVTEAADNQGGVILADTQLTLKAGTLDNRQDGLLGATRQLDLNIGQLDNRGGELSSQQIGLVGERLDNSAAGRVLASGDLTLIVAQVINQSLGLISADQGLSLNGTSLDNQGGDLVGLQRLDLALAGDLDNHQGRISSEGGLGIQVRNLGNRQGSLSSAGALQISAREALDNRGGKLLSDAALTLSSARLDNQQQGVISSKAKLALETGELDNSQGGNLNSGDALNLTATQVNNDQGSIGSAKALQASVSGLQQQGGKLFSKTALSLDLNHGTLNNQGGFINAPGPLVLSNLGTVNNRQGEISSEQAFELAAQSLDNSAGQLLSHQALTLRIDGALTALKGKIAAAALQIDAGSLDNSGSLLSDHDLGLRVAGPLHNQGLIQSAGHLQLSAKGLGNQGGKLLGGTGLSIDLGPQTSDLDNRKGLINTQGVLSIAHLRDLQNREGEISSAQGFNLAGRNLDNSAGTLISQQQLGVEAAQLTNQQGLVSGWQGLNLSGGSLDNRQQGTLSSLLGELNIDLSGALLNSAQGGLASQGRLTLKAASLDNSDKGIVTSKGEQQLILGSGGLNNARGGLIESSASLDIGAGDLDNQGGRLSAAGALSFTGNSLNNQGGNLRSEGAVTLDLLGALVNAQGQLAASGPLLLKRSSRIDNQGGQLISQNLMTLFSASLDNSNRGTLAANGALQVTTTGQLSNQGDGLIYSRDAGLSLNAGSLNNAQGAIQSAKAQTLAMTGDIDNQGGKLIAEDGDLRIQGANLDSRGGVLSSLKGLFEARVRGQLNNHGGQVEARSLDLQALAGIDNGSGRMAAKGGDLLLDTGGAGVDNSNGGLYASGRVKASGHSLNNGVGQINGQHIDLDFKGPVNNRGGLIESRESLALRGASLDNQGGKLRALATGGKTELQIGGQFDNRNGLLETANTDLTLAASDFLNQGGSLLHLGEGNFDIATGNVINAGGSLITRGGLTLTADSWTNSSVIQAGRLNLNVNQFAQTASGQLLASQHLQARGGNWSNDGLLASDGSLDLQIGGTYSGNGRVSSLGDMTFAAAQVNLGSTGSIAGGADTRVNIGGQLNNAGRLTSNATLTVNAGGVLNTGTLGGAQGLSLTTPTLVNDHGFVFSGQNASLNVNTLTNSYGEFYSLGGLTVAGMAAGTSAQSLKNISGNIQSGGDINIAALDLVNDREKYEASQQITDGRMTIRCAQHCGGGASWVRGPVFIYRTVEGVVTSDSPQSTLNAGGNLTVNSSSFLNRYSTVSAGNDLTITSGSITNQASLVASGSSGYEVGAGVKIKRGLFFQLARDVQAYDRAHPQGSAFNQQDFAALVAKFNPGIFYGIDRPVETSTLSSSSAPAIIQAGGKARLTAANDISNISVIKSAIAVGDRARDTGVGAASKPLMVVLNSQLPPDLAQQQVNPLSLPNFSLPSGQNGLFRLSGQGGTAQPAGPAHSWNMGGASLELTSRQAGPEPIRPRDLSSQPLPQVALGARELNLQDHQATGVDGRTAAVQVSATAADSPLGVLPVGGTGNQSVSRVQGLPDSSVRSNPHKYLIETNPLLTDLKQFMSSDYLLSNLGYDPDQSAKRLGDGFYEQRLIQQAVTARTGQRFLDGQNSDEGMFKYLMNNAIASKDSLNLAVGVTLTSQQVAALTHDIVWLEEQEVNGEKVLVPVLYLANANNRLAANGALVQGRDVTLIAGKDLVNSGTLRASENLSATAGSDLLNSGLIEAGNRLNLLAGDNLVNQAGGIIAGRDVTVRALAGDVINERSITTFQSNPGSTTQRLDYANNAARIEARNDLNVGAGRDINNVGGVLSSGGDTTLIAARDVNLVSAQEHDKLTRDRYLNESITQHGSSVSVGRDLAVSAGRDLTAVASQIEAKRNIAMDAAGDMTLASAADEQHSYSKTKKVTRQEDHVSQVGTSLTAGADVVLSAGKDLSLISSRISAGNEAYLVAGDNLELLAAQDSDYSLYDMKKKGSWGRKKTRRDEVTQVTNIGSEITTGGDLTLKSGGDQKYQVAKLESAKDLTLDSGGAITFEGVKDLHDESHTKSNNNAFWNSSKGRGNTDETLRQSSLVAGGSLTIKAVEGLKIDIKHIDQKSVSQAIDAMVQADPQLAWLKQAEARGDVDWRQVKEIHESFKYNNSGLGPAAQLIIAIALAAVMGPMMAGMNTMLQAVAVNAATNATVSTIDNRGNLGKVLKDVTSKESIKGYTVAAATAGVAQGLNYNPSAMGLDAKSLQTVAVKVTADALIKTAVYGGSFKDNLAASAAGTAASIGGAYGAGKIGDLGLTEGGLAKIALHAGLGGLLSEAMGGDFRTGAIAGGANELLVGVLGDKLLPDNLIPGSPEYIQAQANLMALSQIVGVLGAAAAGGDMSIASTVAANGTQNNYLTHQAFDELGNCLSGRTCSTDEQKTAAVTKAEKLSEWLDSEMRSICDKAPTGDGCRAAVNASIKYVAMKDAWKIMNKDVVRSSKNTFDYLYNTEGAATRLVAYLNTIDNRANFFGASNVYEQNLGIGAKWFGGAEEVSRAFLTGLGADGDGSYLPSYITFAAGRVVAPVYNWRKAAGDALITGGFDNFKNLYNKATTDPVAWDIKQLKGEQTILQPVHEKYLGGRDLFQSMSGKATNTSGIAGHFIEERQGVPGGINILDYASRVEFGCKLLGYSKSQGCTP
ncbi:filamentous hemagglutinin N-terminal domain-containing protein [Pseudomonas protegens]|uniref:two-partner secretion domain-containing protein n=1 Tax=Pseudomonas protegens TaxID=380021 RepID=UPI002742B4DF|nr:filamentous hemagglutinin N-terminal domain-containing protein [Pseudomonas protegens]MDP9511632.1 filamentous hemagglutinin N-terminal domain-containing protein [Pseudomonas protegens]